MAINFKKYSAKLLKFRKLLKEKLLRSKDNTNRLILILFIGLFLISSYLIYKNMSKPYIEGKPDMNTFELPEATVNVPYKADIFGTLPFRGTLVIGAINLPDGLEIGDCDSKFDVPVVKVKPNTLTHCILEGTPTKEGNYTVSFVLQSPDNMSSFLSRQELKVLSAVSPDQQNSD